MKKYKITVRINGIKKQVIVEARSLAEAEAIGWSMFDVDDLWVEEVE